jgi:hypothetical protein
MTRPATERVAAVCHTGADHHWLTPAATATEGDFMRHPIDERTVPSGA